MSDLVVIVIKPQAKENCHMGLQLFAFSKLLPKHNLIIFHRSIIACCL